MPIDRTSLVRRHNPVLHAFDYASPLSVGNGEFAFTVDPTGLQTFRGRYAEAGMPLCTQSQWGWHSFPAPAGYEALYRSLTLTPYDASGRTVRYPTRSEGQEEQYRYLRENPHRLNLAALGLTAPRADHGTGAASGSAPGAGGPFRPEDLSGIRQELDLFTGILSSRYLLEGVPVETVTACHPVRDAVSVRISSPLLAKGALALELAFPYGSPDISGSDWNSPECHRSEPAAAGPGRYGILRVLDGTRYHCTLHLGPGVTVRKTGGHVFTLTPAQGAETIEAVVEFTPAPPRGGPLSCAEVEAESARRWDVFWKNGGCIELAESADPRAVELERRIVLSQYLTAIQCAGSLPPQETGLTCNSWYGKFHLEMHYWHAAQFPLWNRPELLERSLWWYAAIRDSARERAESQGYAGVRWPKMTSSEGFDSPSPIGPLLAWQQPHLIMLAELMYRTGGGAGTTETYAELVFETAEFMVSFAQEETPGGRYVLGPPLIPAQENHAPEITLNPTFELEYWRWGLTTANEWRRRAGLPENRRWTDLANRLAKPKPSGGVYPAHERCPETFTAFNFDHPSMLAAFGLLPGRSIDRRTMNATLDAVLERWNFDETWGWDFPMIAMTAARLGRPEDAVSALLAGRPKNTYLPNGHNPQRPKKDLPLYLPGNGALLSAAAMMAAGWDGSDGAAPGFPKDGSWTVRYEALNPVP